MAVLCSNPPVLPSTVQPSAVGEDERVEYVYLPPHERKLRLDGAAPSSVKSCPDATAAEASASSAGPSNASPVATEELMRRKAESRVDAVSVTAFFDDTERAERALELFLEAQFEADEELATALRSHIDVEHISDEDLDAIIDQVGVSWNKLNISDFSYSSIQLLPLLRVRICLRLLWNVKQRLVLGPDETEEMEQRKEEWDETEQILRDALEERRMTGQKQRKRVWRKFLLKGSSAMKLLVNERPAAVKKLAVSCRRREKEQRAKEKTRDEASSATRVHTAQPSP